MTDRADYTPLRHAEVDDDPDVKWVALARWDFSDSVEWTVEYWDDRGEAGSDRSFGSEAGAGSHAMREFHLRPEDWRPGPNPLGGRP